MAVLLRVELQSTFLNPRCCCSFSELNDDWSLATSLKDFSENAEDEMDEDSPEFDIFQVKYLGCTPVDLPRSEEATAEAVRKIIASAKGELSFMIRAEVVPQRCSY